MSRYAKFSLVLCMSLLATSGCAHFVETQTIKRFAENLQHQDMSGLKANTSDDFAQKALRRAESLDDFKIVNLPDGKTSVVKVENVSDDERKVTVEVGESKRRLLYVLTRDADSRRWVVDDIYMTQRSKGLKAAKSVTEQMDLLITVREFLDAWDHGSRQDVLNMTTPEFRDLLACLPAPYLARLTRNVAETSHRESKLRPRAELDDAVAVVSIPRATGSLVVTYRLLNGNWRADDVAMDSKVKEENIPSVRKLAAVVRSTTEFLKAYENRDKSGLALTTTSHFFRGSLAPADLGMVRLPAPDLSSMNYDISMQAGHADFIINTGREIVKLSLVEDRDAATEANRPFFVEDVTIYEVDGSQEKRLSAVFTGNAIMQVFSDAVRARDLDMLRHSSSHDFNTRVWAKLTKDSVRELPLEIVDQSAPQVVKTVFQGAITEIHALHGTAEVTYVLRDRNGELRVDDVLLPVTNRTNSLKQTLEFMVPIQAFASAIRLGDMPLLQRNSSLHFNRLVWHQLDYVPEIGLPVASYLLAPLSGIDMRGDSVVVRFGDDQFGASVTLISEHDNYVVDDVLLIAGPLPQQRTNFKQVMRHAMSTGFSTADSGETPIATTPEDAANTVAPARFESNTQPLR